MVAGMRGKIDEVRGKSGGPEIQDDPRAGLPPPGHNAWRALLEERSRRRGRTIKWPITGYFLESFRDIAQKQRTSGYRPSPKHDFVSLQSPIDWKSNPFRDKMWIFRFQCLQMLDPFIMLHEEGHPALEEAARIALDWCDFHVRQRKQTFVGWFDMAVGYRALKIAYLLSEAADRKLLLSADEGALLMWAAARHIEELSRPEALSRGNHGIFQMYGLTVLSEIAWPLESAAEASRYAQTTFGELLDEQFNDEGLHLEHSPQYHYWMAGELRAIRESGWYPEQEMTFLAKAEEVKHWLVDPSGTLVPAGDTSLRKPSTHSQVECRPDYSGRKFRLRIFPKGGLAVCRSEKAMLYFNAAYHSASHKHADHLSFHLVENAVPFLVDSGAAGFKWDERRAYLLSSRAHNTIEIEGFEHSRNGRDAFGSALGRVRAYDWGVLLEGSVEHRNGVTHLRTLRYAPGKWLIINDVLQSDIECSYIQWLQFGTGFDIDGNTVRGNGLAATVLHDEDAVVTSHRGDTSPLRGWRAAGIGMPLVPALSLAIRKRGSNVSFRTAIVQETGGFGWSDCGWLWEAGAQDVSRSQVRRARLAVDSLH